MSDIQNIVQLQKDDNTQEFCEEFLKFIPAKTKGKYEWDFSEILI